MIDRLIALIVVATFAQGACAARADERIDLPTFARAWSKAQPVVLAVPDCHGRGI